MAERHIKKRIPEMPTTICLLLLLSVPTFAETPTLDQLKAALDQPVEARGSGSCPAPEKFSVTRPDPPGTPTVVGLAVLFQDVSALNDVDQSITADIDLIARWRDPRLADSDGGNVSVDCTSSLKPLWMPTLEPENLRARERFYDDRILINSSGIVTLTRRLIVQVAQPMDFTDFPFDRHLWKFAVMPVYSDSSELLFHPLPWTSGPERPTIQGWQLGSPHPQTTLTRRGNRMGSFSRFEATLEVRRMPQFYRWVLGIPLLLIGLMAYLVYFIPASMVPQQIALGMTAILTAVAYMLTLNSSLPKIGYLTRADYLFVAIIVLAFLSLVKGVFTAALGSGQRSEVINNKLERLGRWLYPVVMITAFTVALRV
jgi:hypothetical protein